ncbi:MAG: flagellar filament capping protein FliD [Planctomycetes bacterium]|nr:flagellar filament capping protein FliD [Planctomycetota bacterium]
MPTFGSGLGIGGVASGLDTNTIISKLVQLESIPIQQLNAKKAKHQEKLGGINRLKTLIQDLQTKAKAASTSANFLSYVVKSSVEGVAGFTVTGSAAAGAHTLTVQQLASIDRWAFDGVASSTTNLTAATGQTVNFTVNGTDYSVAVDPAESTLENIAQAINTAATADLTATVVNTGAGSNPSYKLVLTAKGSGEEARITNIASTVDGLTIDSTAPDDDGIAQSLNNITVGLNAFAIVDGLQVERTTNEFAGVINGVTFTAQSADPAAQMSFSIEPNKAAVKQKVTDLVDAYNAVINYANAQSTYTKEGGASGVLFGDSLLSSVRRSIGSALFNVPIDTVINDTAGYSTLNVIGITTNRDGTLTIDQTKLDDKLANDLAAFADLFVDRDGFDNGGAAVNTPEYYTDTTADSGLAATLVRAIDQMFGSSAGEGGTTIKALFDARTETITGQMRDIDKQVLQKQTFIDSYEASLIARFSSLESLIGKLNSQGAGFAAAIAGLNR